MVLLGCTTGFFTVIIFSITMFIALLLGVSKANLTSLLVMVAVAGGLATIAGLIAAKFGIKTPEGAGHFGNENLSLHHMKEVAAAKLHHAQWKDDWVDIPGEKTVKL